MKKVPLLLCFVSLVSFSFAQKIKFEKAEWAKILEKSKKENKPIFVDFYATWCGPCKDLEKFVYKDKAVGKYMNQNFINVKIDAEKQELALVEKSGIDSYPTLVYFTKDGDEIGRYSGYREVEEFLEEAEEMQAEAKLPSLAVLEKAFTSGDKSEATLKSILKKRSKLDPTRLDNEAYLIEYLQVIKLGPDNANEVFRLFYDNIRSITKGSKAYDFFLKHGKAFQDEYDSNNIPSEKEYIRNIDAFIAYVDIERALLTKDEKKIDAAVEGFRNATKENSIYYIDPEFSIQDMLKAYYIANDKPKYLAFAQKYLASRYPVEKGLDALKNRFKNVYDYNVKNISITEEDSIVNPEEYKIKLANLQLNSYLAEDLNNTVWAVYENTEDPAIIKKMLPFAKASVDLNESYYNVDTYAHILDKTGQKKEALWYEKKAIRLAKFFASEDEAESSQAEFDKFNEAFIMPAIRPMALDKNTLENHLEAYLHHNMLLDYDKILEFMPPLFFKQFKKEDIKVQLQSAYEMEEMFINMDKVDLKVASDILTENGKAFAKVNMFIEMTIDVSKMTGGEGKTAADKKTMLNAIAEQYTILYGKDNFIMDEDKSSFHVKNKTNVYAIGDKNLDSWKFINYDEKLKGIIDTIISENMRDKLK
jgi:thiol-disulfide isomerase/thioredoxin